MEKSSLNLKQIYEMRLTAERKVEAFRRYVIRLKRQRNLGRDLSCFDYMRSDIRLFREEAFYMKNLDAKHETYVRLAREIRCLEEMTDEQILCYYTLVKRFRKNMVERADVFYARYYLLEIANLIYHDTPKEACEAMFSFWPLLKETGKAGRETEEYFCTLCRLFMLTFRELMPQIIDRLEEETGRDWSGRIFARMEKGSYEAAGRYIRQYARKLTENDVSSDKEYVVHAWRALPYVFRALEESFGADNFRSMILNGFYASMYIGEYPVMCRGKGKERQVQISRYVYYEYQDYSDYWKYWYYVLRESVQDFLCVIYQQTESGMRRHFMAPPRKGSIRRFVGKAYSASADRPQDVQRIKEMLTDERFQEAVETGVLDYLTTEDAPIPDRKRRRVKRAKKKETEQEADYEKLRIPAALDQEKLKKAREDAESVLGMLKEGEIEYRTEDEDGVLRGPHIQEPAVCREEAPRSRTETAAVEAQGEESAAAWSEAEKRYLRLLRAGDRAALEDHLRALRMPEHIMMKHINHKALELLGDLLLEKEAEAVRVLEDYEEEADRIAGEGP